MNKTTLSAAAKVDQGMALNTVNGFYFDTRNSITANLERSLLEEALVSCARYESLLSRFVEGSDVWRINHSAGEPVEVSTDCVTLLRCAEEVRKASGGAFNIAIGSASSLWRFTDPKATLPSQTELAQAARRLAEARIEIDAGALTVRVSAGTLLDLGGIAKGYICDQIADQLREQGATSGILNFGGNVVAIGQHPEGRPWQVGLQTPSAQREHGIFAVVEGNDNAVVTSGVYERVFELDGKLYHHILDPRTCLPMETDIHSVTVVAADAMLADALSTALLILGCEEGFALAERFGVQAAILKADGQLEYSQDLRLELVRPEAQPTVAHPLLPLG